MRSLLASLVVLSAIAAGCDKPAATPPATTDTTAPAATTETTDTTAPPATTTEPPKAP